MKRLIMLLCLLGSKAVMAQMDFFCPCGQTISLHIDKLKLHRPKKDCLIGFGLCLRIDKISIDCNPCQNGSEPKPSLNGDAVVGYLNNYCGVTELHLPVALLRDEQFKDQDMSEFEIESGFLSFPGPVPGQMISVRAGVYPVHERDGELVIPVNLEW